MNVLRVDQIVHTLKYFYTSPTWAHGRSGYTFWASIWAEKSWLCMSSHFVLNERLS